MITVQEARQIIFDNLLPLEIEKKETTFSIGNILQEDILADRDFPPFDRVMMDGIAIRFSDWQKGSREFQVVHTQLAGTAPTPITEENACVEIMTGAICPTGLDVVIRVEDIEIEERDGERFAKVSVDSVQQNQNIHAQGIDRTQGSLLIAKGTKMGLAEVAVAVSVGKKYVKVSQVPKVAIISTGDELVDIEESPLPHQIRRSNNYTLFSILQNQGTTAELFHINDNKEAIQATLENIFENFDLIILSGGVSKGKADYIPEVLESLGVEKLFHRVAQRPGKPFWFGKKENKRIFAFPGNPVSTIVCFYHYFLPYLGQLSGDKNMLKNYAKLQEDLHFKPNLTYFAPVKLTINELGELWAKPFKGQGSGDFANLLQADAFMEFPPEKNYFQKGEVFPVTIYRQ